MSTAWGVAPTTPSKPSGESHSGSTGWFSSPGKLRVTLCLLIALATLIVYNGVSRNGFINLDDNLYLIQNQHVHEGLTLNTVKWAFTTYEVDNWHPLTWMSFALDWQLFGKNTGGHHYVSALFHALNAALLFLLLASATGFTWRSSFVAALFAVHPVNVESVAWAAERKNVLSMLFFLLAMMAYGRYAKCPSVRRYVPVTLLYVLGLLAKPQVITLPFVLLLWDYWPLRRMCARDPQIGAGVNADERFAPTRISRLIIEKIPLFFIAAVDVVLTLHAEN